MEPFFSRLGISRLEPIIAQVVEKLHFRLKALEGTNTVINLNNVYSAFSGDVIRRLCWGDEADFLNDPQFTPAWYVAIDMAVPC